MLIDRSTEGKWVQPSSVVEWACVGNYSALEFYDNK